MKKVLTVLSLASLSLLSVSCGSSSSDDGVDGISGRSEQYTYRLSYNGCDTGAHTFKSLQAKCDGLRSYSLNKGCAYSLRAQEFKSSGCSGSFSETD